MSAFALLIPPADFSICLRRLTERSPTAYINDIHPQLRSRSEEHTSELQSLMRISYAVFCLKKKKFISKISKSLHKIQYPVRQIRSETPKLINMIYTETKK